MHSYMSLKKSMFLCCSHHHNQLLEEFLPPVLQLVSPCHPILTETLTSSQNSSFFFLSIIIIFIFLALYVSLVLQNFTNVCLLHLLIVSFLQLRSILLCKYTTFAQSCADKNFFFALCFFFFFFIMHKVLLWTFVCKFFCVCVDFFVSFIFGVTLRTGILGSGMFHFTRNC